MSPETGLKICQTITIIGVAVLLFGVVGMLFIHIKKPNYTVPKFTKTESKYTRFPDGEIDIVIQLDKGDK